MSSSNVTVLVEKLRRHLRKHGIWGLMKSIPAYVVYRWRVWLDGTIDRKYGTDTGGVLEKEVLGAGGEHSESSTGYEPIQVALFRRIMRNVPVDLSKYVFVDFGSGKGRALLLAAEYGFKRAVGVEISPVLDEIARRNIARVKNRTDLSPIELHCLDATQYQPPEEDALCFFYNPFSCTVMGKVVQNLEISYRRHPRRLVIVYRNPVCAEMLDNCGFLRLAVADRHYRIYQSTLGETGNP